ncbi:predicted protein [Histoplasma capsulatum G186AR]|uniref:Uncharacterized protein n=1 Tax=Ajellomyces capsulatus (strain G186AR / H82 / ATCC MYA-2454 / RMSCC 2432) TaxID=447093 RepID=C0P1A5_AJECG|nr:uncharacterized protein HCBG_09185 [Histoplasma capsulatum G186AR]EEH02574.1 predicted protein [Histoplasma capsulatum G186AR]
MASTHSICCTHAIIKSEATNIIRENHKMCIHEFRSAQQTSFSSEKSSSEYSSEEDISSEGLSAIKAEKIAVTRQIKKLQAEKELQELQYKCDTLLQKLDQTISTTQNILKTSLNHDRNATSANLNHENTTSTLRSLEPALRVSDILVESTVTTVSGRYSQVPLWQLEL